MLVRKHRLDGASLSTRSPNRPDDGFRTNSAARRNDTRAIPCAVMVRFMGPWCRSGALPSRVEGPGDGERDRDVRLSRWNPSRRTITMWTSIATASVSLIVTSASDASPARRSDASERRRPRSPSSFRSTSCWTASEYSCAPVLGQSCRQRSNRPWSASKSMTSIRSITLAGVWRSPGSLASWTGRTCGASTHSHWPTGCRRTESLCPSRPRWSAAGSCRYLVVGVAGRQGELPLGAGSSAVTSVSEYLRNGIDHFVHGGPRRHHPSVGVPTR